ncbi:MAG TPA: flagellar export chaperone FlgN [Polyangia bacterium]|nr:flagellar export chaperone FlgN [Polyangia bacterium]
MDQLEEALTVVDSIREALEAEVERARQERALIRTMNVDGLVARANLRASFNDHVRGLQQHLARALAAAGAALGLNEVTVATLGAALPGPAAHLDEGLAAIRSLAAALAELDDLNRILGQRALSYVRAYLGVLNPTPAAYNRRGSSTGIWHSRTVSRVA